MLGTADLRGDLPAEAVGDFGKALAIAPGNIDALRGRATAFGRQEKYADAIADFGAILALHPDDSGPDGARVALLQSGDPAFAVADFTTLPTATPNDAEIRHFRATASCARARPRMPRLTSRQCCKRGRTNLDAFNGRGLARLVQGAFAAAEDDFSASLATRANTGDVLSNRGQLRFLRGDNTGAPSKI